jgi:hypothetical protein
MVKSTTARISLYSNGMAATTLPTTAFPPRQAVLQTGPAQSYAPVQAEETSPFQKFGFQFLLVFLFLAFSRVFDVKFSTLHITGISYRGCLRSRTCCYLLASFFDF